MAEIDQGQLKGAFDSLLNYINTPWRVIAIAFLGLLCLGAYMVIQNQHFLLAAYEKNKSIPKVDVSKADAAAKLIFSQTPADMVVFFEVDVILGTRSLLRAYTREGRDKSHDGIDVGMLSANPENNADLLSMYAGNISCSSYRRAQSVLGIWYLQNGLSFMCRSSMPSTPGVFSGQVTVGFKTPPQDIEKIQDIMTIAADMMVVKK